MTCWEEGEKESEFLDYHALEQKNQWLTKTTTPKTTKQTFLMRGRQYRKVVSGQRLREKQGA